MQQLGGTLAARDKGHIYHVIKCRYFSNIYKQPEILQIRVNSSVRHLASDKAILA